VGQSAPSKRRTRKVSEQVLAGHPSWKDASYTHSNDGGVRPHRRNGASEFIFRQGEEAHQFTLIRRGRVAHGLPTPSRPDYPPDSGTGRFPGVVGMIARIAGISMPGRLNDARHCFEEGPPEKCDSTTTSATKWLTRRQHNGTATRATGCSFSISRHLSNATKAVLRDIPFLCSNESRIMGWGL
jgi:hypothetical protein